MPEPLVDSVYKYKCMRCGLHFALYTYYPNAWKKRLPRCPECGNQEPGSFCAWAAALNEPIFQQIPGKTPEIASPTLEEINKLHAVIADRVKRRVRPPDDSPNV